MLQTAEEWIERLKLRPLAPEGGWYKQTYRSDESIGPAGIPSRYGAARAVATAIYYLITPTSFSLMHRVRSDETFHFYGGDPVTMLQLLDAGTGRTVRLGNSGAPDQEPQVTVPRRVWQGLQLEPGGKFALLGATVAPGFDPQDFELGERSALLQSHPKFETGIIALTRSTS